MKTNIKIILTIIVVIILIVAVYAAYVVLNEEKNTPPDTPECVAPLNNATGIGVTTELQWTSDDADSNDTVHYDVYFGEESPPSQVSFNQSGTSYDPGILEYNTQYYWQIIAWDSHEASTEGSLWSFTTSEMEPNSPPSTPSNPNPSNSATQVSITTDLGWSGGDPNTGDSVTYDVYFGTTNPPQKVTSNQTGTTYDLGSLQYTSKYYWKIIVWDSSGISTSGSTWSFTTVAETNGGTPDYLHTVFIEEATAGTCKSCPAVATILHDLYSSGLYRFYYVSLVHDENTLAQERLTNEYNVYGFPTVYIDGGYDVILGKDDQTTFQDSIVTAMDRDVPSIQVSVSAEWDNDTKTFETTVTIVNDEQSQYSGRLKVYLTEKISRWYDYDGNPYSYALLDFIIDKDITVPAGGSISESKVQDPSDADPDNLMIFAVVFSSETNQGYSQPPADKSFDAYYADAVDAAEVIEGGNLPPSVGLAYPKKLHINIFGKAKRMTPLRKNTVLIGRTTVKVNASDDSGITRVEFLVDGKSKVNDTTAPYEWTVRKFGLIKHLIRRHTITVIAYDNEGKSSSVDLDVISFFL